MPDVLMKAVITPLLKWANLNNEDQEYMNYRAVEIQLSEYIEKVITARSSVGC